MKVYLWLPEHFTAMAELVDAGCWTASGLKYEGNGLFSVLLEES